MNRAVADTHALIWWSLGPPKKLGRRARALFARAERGNATIYIPVLGFVEVSEAMRRGAFPGAAGFSRWMEAVVASTGFAAADLTADVVLEAETIHLVPERGDRLIAATALHLGCPLITRDPVFTRVPGLTTIW